jgi:hypothetical protein
MKTIKYYHYTTEIRIPEIIKSGKINLATLYVYGKEKPCTWISSNHVWENSATKMASTSDGRLTHLNFEQQLELFGCARIEVKPTNLYHWPKLKHLIRIDSEKAQQLEDIGIERGANPLEWYGSLFSIGIDQWIKIEIYKNGKWSEYTK